MATLLNPFIRALDANGDPVSGAQLAVFEAGTTTPVTTYSDRALSTAQAQPLIANSAGEFAQSFVATGIYKIRVSDADGVTLYENDNVRIADRPDDPVFFDTIALLLASTDTYAAGTLLLTVKEGARYTALASGATNFSDENAGGQKLMRGYQVYDTVADFLNSVEPSRGVGSIWEAAEFTYTEATSGASDHHVTNGAGVKFYVSKNSAGAYPVAAFGEISATDNAALCETVAGAISRGDSIVFPVGDFPIGQEVDFDVPQDCHIVCWGTKFRCTHNGIGFNLNSGYTPADASPATKRNVHFWGGQWENTNSTKTASEAIRAYGMRMLTLNQVKFGPEDFVAGSGFAKAVVLSAKDTYILNQCYWYNNELSLYIPAIGVRSADRTINVELNQCHFSSANKTNAILVEDNISGFKMNGGSVNSSCSDGAVLFKDNSLVPTECLKFNDVHFEQFDENGALVFLESNNFGFYDIVVNSEFISGAAGNKGIILDYCRGVKISSFFRDGSGGSTEEAISVNSTCRDVTIQTENSNFLNIATGKKIVLSAVTDRQYVSIVPNIVAFSPVALTGYVLTAKSTGSGTLDMSSVFSGFSSYALPPKGYILTLTARDSGSSGATVNKCFAKLYPVSGNVNAGVNVELAGVINDGRISQSGTVYANSNGDIDYLFNSTGADTLDVGIYVTGVIQ